MESKKSRKRNFIYVLQPFSHEAPVAFYSFNKAIAYAIRSGAYDHVAAEAMIEEIQIKDPKGVS